MYYRGKHVAVTGFSGFIGQSLVEALEKQGTIISFLHGDIRSAETFGSIDHKTDYIFHFAAPSSQVLFARQPALSTEVTIKGFMNAVDAAAWSGAKLIYPSTGLLSQGRTNEYANSKRFCEEYAAAMRVDSLGLRIFATYGPGEEHKRDYASVPYLFARDLVMGRSPVIFGDGEQKRDFIFIEDTVEAILELAESCNAPTIDVGSGQAISFKEIAAMLQGMTAGPGATFIERPENYVDETLASVERLHKFYVPKVSMEVGLMKMVDSIKATLGLEESLDPITDWGA